MRVGLLSDTHVPVAPLFPEVLDALRGVDVILHAGDIVLSRVLDELELVFATIGRRLRAAADRQVDLAGEPTPVRIADAMAGLSSGSTYIAASPPTSGRDAARVLTTGAPTRIASITGSPNPS